MKCKNANNQTFEISHLEYLFLSYFKSNPQNSYRQFIDKFKDDIDFEINIDSMRRKLQRYKLLRCTKTNGADGTFYSHKTVDCEFYS